ncbi:SH3 and multiple ankyrin repeat domain protein 3-like protein [Turdus rufiventris]|nr:SH3 and multiple ankyrin repeat domain protein 3-like protein [Turdus rufiventris]
MAWKEEPEGKPGSWDKSPKKLGEKPGIFPGPGLGLEFCPGFWRSHASSMPGVQPFLRDGHGSIVFCPEPPVTFPFFPSPFSWNCFSWNSGSPESRGLEQPKFQPQFQIRIPPRKCLRLNPDVPVWVSKQRILCTLNHSLKDVLNYGLFQPAFNGRAGKFLDEERLLREYPLSPHTPLPYLEANLKKFMEYVQMLNSEKVCRLLEKGLDPNFHDPDTGECPLTAAAQLELSAEMIKALRNGGAHLDFRTREGMTALHKAVRCRNHAALLACRYGHVQHLEHLLFYGADMTAQNASGNTALHICALYNQESCARVLLFRGASKEIRNYNSQTAFQVAIIAGNFELAEIIKTHKESDVGPFQAPSPLPFGIFQD